MSVNSYTRAFLIGAGASLACKPQLPLDANFFNILRRTYNVQYSAISNTLARSNPKYGNDKLQDFGLEEIIMAAENISDSEQIVFHNSIMKGIHRLIVSPIEAEDPSEPLNYYDVLVRHPKFSYNDFFINLNYDIMLDRAIWNLSKYRTGHKTIDYGFDGNGTVKASGSVQLLNDKAATIFKPHGSLNWLSTKQNDIVIHDHMEPIDWIDDTLILPPGKKTMEKTRTQWLNMEHRLSQADELIIIGCSLSKNDQELNNIVMKYFGHKNIGAKKVKVITRQVNDKNKEIQFREIFGEKMLFHQDGFSYGAIEFIYNQ